MRDVHRYKLGAAVSLAPTRGMPRNQAAIYKVIAHLPSNGVHLQYRIRNSEEAFERVATENELVARGAAQTSGAST
ncbi:MAG: hypothetical protein K2Q06_03155 [Parvularculaceae bacterium]|nr:hypothetical protein [Parvularculaceae bacterium]